MPDLLAHPIVYRFWRLRRLFLFALALPLAALVGLAASTGGTAFLWQGPPFQALALFWTGALAALMIRYPAAAGEVIICALTLAGLILLSPLAEMLAAHARGPLTGGEVFALFLLTLFAASIVFLFAAAFVTWLCTLGPRRQRRWTVTYRTDLPADQAYALLRPTPNTASRWRRYGSADENGRFPAWISQSYRKPPPDTAEARAKADQPSYWVEVTEYSPLSCGTVAVIEDGRTEGSLLTVQPDGTGAVIKQQSVHNIFRPWEAFVFYLIDFATDSIVASLDSATDRTPDRAILLLPFDAPTLWIARTFGTKQSE
jgi:hypothetical protein